MPAIQSGCASHTKLRHHWQIARWGMGVGDGFWGRLKQRKLVQWAVAYIAAAFAFIQGLDVVVQRFVWPDRIEKIIILVLAIGFFVALVLAWYHGERGAQKIGGVELLIIALLLAIGGGALWAYSRAPRAAAPMVASSPDGVKRNPGGVPDAIPGSTAGAVSSGLRISAAAQTIPAKSVAVLPFANEGEKSEQFFSDGLSEDLITALSQFAGLKVISRNSAFQFRDSKDTSAKIGTLLGVAHLLEGSVQRAGDEVRITATLVNASDGTVLWTQRYDKPYKDLFALQDAITQSVADALKAKLLTAPGVVVQSDRPPSGSLAAYTAYLHGTMDYAAFTEAGLRKAIVAYQKATVLDPHYARAYAALSRTWTRLAGAFLGGSEHIRAYAAAREAADKALQLDPASAAAYNARGMLAYYESDWKVAQADLERALQLSPHDVDTQYLLGSQFATIGQIDQGIDLTRQALVSDPRNTSSLLALSQYLLAAGRLDEAREKLQVAITLTPDGTDLEGQSAIFEIVRGDAKAALAAALREPPGPWHDVAMAQTLQIGSDHAAANAALEALVAKYADSAPYQIAEVYALRKDPDNMFKWLDRAWAIRDPGISYLLYDPLILRYRNDSRFAAFCKKVGLPTTTDAVAIK